MKWFSAALLLALVCSCSPVYQTTYEIIPPKTDSAKQCAKNCLQAQTSCYQTCQLNETHCIARARRDRINDPLQFVTVRGSDQTPVVITQRNPRRYYNCSTLSCRNHCLEHYHQCHKTCGGEIIEHQRCTRFCE